MECNIFCVEKERLVSTTRIMIAIVAIVLVIAFYSMYTYYRVHIESDLKIIKHRRMIVDIYKGFRRMRHIYNNFELWELYNVLTEDECKKIIQMGEEEGFYESRVYNKNGQDELDTKNRLSGTISFTNKSDPVIMRISEMTEQLTGLPIENQEFLQLTKYNEGGKYKPHFDTGIGDTDNKGAGDRRATFLIYLNDDFKGGETNFPSIGLTIQPKRGKAILFWNTDKDENIYEESKHQGMSVLEGQKYICTKWSHLRAYPEYH